jgi:hypothetical protein
MKFRKTPFRITISFLLLFSFCVGFRLLPGSAKWAISVSDPNIWIRVCERPDFPSETFPANDPLHGSSLSFTNVLQSIRNDYDSVPTTYIHFLDTAVDAGFNPNTDRVIDVCFASMFGAAGLTSRVAPHGVITGCKIKLDPHLKSKASSFVAVLTHELGHCMGLDHTQDLTHSIMSYFAERDVIRLQVDDKMGLTYLYPTDPSYADEKATLGLSCN